MDKNYSPYELAELLGIFPPSEEQAKIISAPPQGNYLIVAGAGAGKTETMAARVVWLVANGYVQPEQILGLTFTRKAARGLAERIRKRLEALAQSRFMDDIRAVNPQDPRLVTLKNLSLSISTYDSYAGNIVREYGLLYPIEPHSRIITDAERWMIAQDVVRQWDGSMELAMSFSNVIDNVLNLVTEMDNHLVSIQEVETATRQRLEECEQLPEELEDRGFTAKQRSTMQETLDAFFETQKARLEILPIVEEYKKELQRRNVMGFGEQTTCAAQLAQKHSLIGEQQRERFRVILFDEYQDTGYAQRVLLRSLFGNNTDPELTVTAVGDPMQSIYLFRGATASNLEKFRTDFPCGDNPATTLSMSLSFRNPSEVLSLANRVTSWLTDINGDSHLPEEEKSVVTLCAGENNKQGEVSIGFFDHEEEEIAWLADRLAEQWKQHSHSDFSAAVLVRINKHSLPIYQALTERGVPAEITTGTGLLDLPEVAIVYAMLRAVVNSHDEEALLQVLVSPRWNIGAADIMALSRKATAMAKEANRLGQTRAKEAQQDSDTHLTPWQDSCKERIQLTGFGEKLTQELLSLIPDPMEIRVSLYDALVELRPEEENQNFSPEGYRRLCELAAEFRYLSQASVEKDIPDFLADIERITGVRTEVLTAWHRSENNAIGTSHLDAFADIVRGFSELPSASLSSLVDYLAIAKEKENGLEPGEVIRKKNIVQILTVHKAKGLEWDIVAVPFAHRGIYQDSVPSEGFDRRRVSTWDRNIHRIPTELRGDAAIAENKEGMRGSAALMPVYDGSTSADQIDYVLKLQSFRDDIGAYEAIESQRVFYVAITRTERVLYVTGSAQNNDASASKDPSLGLVLLREGISSSEGTAGEIVCWSNDGQSWSPATYKTKKKEAESSGLPEHAYLFPDEETNNYRQELKKQGKKGSAQDSEHPVQERGLWPLVASEKIPDILKQADQPWQTDPNTQAHMWALETELLIKELEKSQENRVDIPLPPRLTATQAVAMKENPEEFARRLRRPIPMQPQQYAKRGTAFHNWVENLYSSPTLLDEDQLPGAADYHYKDPMLKKLQEQFLASEWAEKTPLGVEVDYTVALADHIFEGKIDAVFHAGNDYSTGWTIVDWKTGAKPVGKSMEAAKMQLAVYRAAWAKLVQATYGVDVAEHDIRAVFYYVRINETYEPELPSPEEFERFLDLSR